eukprot:sb/3475115/
MIQPDIPELAWSLDTLRVGLPLDISLDGLFREVIEQTTSTSDPQTRVVLCELLHSLFLVAIGTEQSAPAKIKELYDHGLPLVLQLGCDSNTVVRELYRTLSLQLVHWHSSGDTQPYILSHILVLIPFEFY